MRYFFDVRDAAGATPDEEGVECGSPEAAVREAAVAAAAMSADLAGNGGGDLTIEVRDADGPVAVVRIAMQIELQRGEKNRTAP